MRTSGACLRSLATRHSCGTVGRIVSHRAAVASLTALVLLFGASAPAFADSPTPTPSVRPTPPPPNPSASLVPSATPLAGNSPTTSAPATSVPATGDAASTEATAAAIAAAQDA